MTRKCLFRKIFTLCTVALLTSHMTLAQHNHDEPAVADDRKLGAVDFEVSCDKSVQKDFDRALSYMHHMMYENSRSAFEAIIETDPGCAMAHWGIATTLFQPLWPTRPEREELDRGWQEIQKAQKLEPAIEREQQLIKATAAFFRDPDTAEYWKRIRRWAEGMAIAYEANPHDPDIAALYALSRLVKAQNAEESESLRDEAEEVLRQVWRAEPSHPGAIHYIIHATDADGRAENALDIVQDYAEIAPDVPHALHMPTHIYVRLGDWPKVIEWNKRSADAARNSTLNGAVSHHYVHAVDYMLYAYLQQGKDDKAQEVFEEAMEKDKHQASFISTFHLAAMPARLAVERHQWHDAVALEPGTPDYLPWENAYWPIGLTWFARGFGSLHTGELELAREAEQQLGHLRDQAKASGEQLDATYIEIDRRILAGWIAAEDDREEAVQLIRSAAQLEGTVEKPAVSPGALLPPYEALGDLLISMDRAVEALEAYQLSDDTWPGRFNTLLGAARAANAAGDETTARKYYRRLHEIAGDSGRAGISEGRQFLNK